MMDILLKTLITFFAIYGVTQFIKDIFLFLSREKNCKYTIVVKVKDAQDSLEAIVRMIVWKTLAFTGGHHMPEILIVDMGSTDSTAEIAKRLCNDYSFIAYTTLETYEKIKSKE
jgi:hypothetical protein